MSFFRGLLAEEMESVRFEIAVLRREVEFVRRDMAFLQGKISMQSPTQLDVQSLRSEVVSGEEGIMSLHRLPTGCSSVSAPRWPDLQSISPRHVGEERAVSLQPYTDLPRQLTDASSLSAWTCEQRTALMDAFSEYVTPTNSVLLNVDPRFIHVLFVAGGVESFAGTSQCYGCLPAWTCVVVCVWVTMAYMTGVKTYAVLADPISYKADIYKSIAWACFFAASLVHWLSALYLRSQVAPLGVYCIPIIRLAVLGLCNSVVGTSFNLITRNGGPPLTSIMWTCCCCAAVGTHVISAVLLQADLNELRQALKLLAHHDAMSLHRVAWSELRKKKNRWIVFLLLHLVPEMICMVLFTIAALQYIRDHEWRDVVDSISSLFAVLFMMLCQIIPIVSYNEAVVRTRLRLEEFTTMQRFNRLPVEFTFFGVTIAKRSFYYLLVAGVSSAMSFLMRELLIVFLFTPKKQ